MRGNAVVLHNANDDHIEVDADIGERIRRTARDIEKLLWLRDIELITNSNYIVKGLIYAGDISFWFGQSGFGKSFLITDIAAHIASGREFLGRKVRQTGVLIVPLEGQRGAKKRLYAIRVEFGKDLKLAIYDDSLDLSSGTDDVGKLIKTMKREFADCGFLVIDTLSRLLGSGSDSDPKDMNRAFQQFARIQRETGVHLAIVHHPGHSDTDRPRGFSNIKPNVDTLVRIDRPGDGDISTAIVLKQKDGEEGQRIAFKLRQIVLGYDEDGDEISTCTVDYVDPPPQQASAKKSPDSLLVFGQAFNECLHTDARKHLVMKSPGVRSPEVTAVPVLRVREEFFKRWATGEPDPAKAKDARRKAWNWALKHCGTEYGREVLNGENEMIWRT
jgi:hypothetical protein